MADKEYTYFSFIPTIWSSYNIKSDKLLSSCEQTNEKCVFVKQDSHFLRSTTNFVLRPNIACTYILF